MTKRILEILGVFLLVAFFGCAEPADTPSGDDEGSIFPHPAGWAAFTYHGSYVEGHGLENCSNSCHGEDYHGGSAIACYFCHGDYPHTEGWSSSHKATLIERGSTSSCATNCHNENLSDCTTCHPQYPHASGWMGVHPEVAASLAESVDVPLFDIISGEVALDSCTTRCHNLPDSIGSTCRGCHSEEGHSGEDWETTHRNEDATGCTTCHESTDERNVCLTCHHEDGRDTNHRDETPADCADCHESTDERNVCLTCHHEDDRDTDHSDETPADSDCATCHESTDERNVCLACHHPTDEWETTHRDEDADDCTTCHESTDERNVCLTCHHPADDWETTHSDEDVASCVTCHESTGERNACLSCHHPAGDWGTTHRDEDRVECTTCHEATDERDVCLTCHHPADDWGTTHRDEDAADCTTCHDSTDDRNVCLTCHHEDGLDTDHRDEEPADCVDCHESTPERNACLTCHHEDGRDMNHRDETPDNCTTCHDSSPERNVCLTCHHPADDWEGIHEDEDRTECVTCHESTPERNVCLTCHHEDGQDTDHRDEDAADCADCHESTDERNACLTCHHEDGRDTDHEDETAATADCADCHETTDERNVCLTCHHEDGRDTDHEDETAATADCADCHPSSEERNVCLTCHHEDGRDADHSSETPADSDCATCHESTDERNVCLSCHHPEADWATTGHGLASLGGLEHREEECGDCHGEMTYSPDTDNFCQECHSNYPHPTNPEEGESLCVNEDEDHPGWTVLWENYLDEDDADLWCECPDLPEDLEGVCNRVQNISVHAEQYFEQSDAGLPDPSDHPEYCITCHGTDYAGGNSDVSCSDADCHLNTPHPDDWLGDGGLGGSGTHGPEAYGDDKNSCIIGRCHGTAFAGGPRGTSCFDPRCHPDFPHPDEDPNPFMTIGDPGAHWETFIDRIQAGDSIACAECHGYGYNRSMGGVSCRNDSCHPLGITHRTIWGFPWGDAFRHGAYYANNFTSESTDANCGLCHGAPVGFDDSLGHSGLAAQSDCYGCHWGYPHISYTTTLPGEGSPTTFDDWHLETEPLEGGAHEAYLTFSPDLSVGFGIPRPPPAESRNAVEASCGSRRCHHNGRAPGSSETSTLEIRGVPLCEECH